MTSGPSLHSGTTLDPIPRHIPCWFSNVFLYSVENRQTVDVPEMAFSGHSLCHAVTYTTDTDRPDLVASAIVMIGANQAPHTVCSSYCYAWSLRADTGQWLI